MRVATLFIIIWVFAILPVNAQWIFEPSPTRLRIVASKKQDAVESGMAVLEKRMTEKRAGSGSFYGQGYIINYGTGTEILAREKQLQNTTFLQRRLFHDGPRITFVRGGFRPIASSDIWFVPPGVDDPVPDSGYRIVTVIGDLNEELLMAEVDHIYIDLGNVGQRSKAYFVVSGPTRDRRQFVRKVSRYVRLRKFPQALLEFRYEKPFTKFEVTVYAPAQ